MATKALFNSVVNWFIKQRIDQIQHFKDYPIETQHGVLFSQLYHAEDTEYGKIYGFSTKKYKFHFSFLFVYICTSYLVSGKKYAARG